MVVVMEIRMAMVVGTVEGVETECLASERTSKPRTGVSLTKLSYIIKLTEDWQMYPSFPSSRNRFTRKTPESALGQSAMYWSSAGSRRSQLLAKTSPDQ